MTTNLPGVRAWVDIDLEALAANVRAFQQVVPAPVLPMLKANAYGLGAVAVSRALEPLEPWGYGVATLAEAEALRKAGIDRPILVFTPPFPDEFTMHRRLGTRPLLGDLETLAAWLTSGGGVFHLEIDTGMRRAGLPWHDAAALDRARTLLAAAEDWEGVCTHFHSPESNLAGTRLQWDRFHDAVRALGRRPALLHAASSGGGFADHRFGADLARPGIYLYGGRVGAQVPRPVAALRARVISTRQVGVGDTVSYGATWRASQPTTIATIAAGYADGVLRSLSNAGQVEILGQRCPIVGRVTMDMTMVDLRSQEVPSGAVATLWGGVVSVDEQAALGGTIAYELLTSLGPRVERRYGREEGSG